MQNLNTQVISIVCFDFLRYCTQHKYRATQIIPFEQRWHISCSAHLTREERVLKSNVFSSNSALPATVERAENSLVTAQATSQANTSLDWLFNTPPSPPRTQTAPPPQASVGFHNSFGINPSLLNSLKLLISILMNVFTKCVCM